VCERVLRARERGGTSSEMENRCTVREEIPDSACPRRIAKRFLFQPERRSNVGQTHL